jgi:hypothetical protein
VVVGGGGQVAPSAAAAGELDGAAVGCEMRSSDEVLHVECGERPEEHELEHDGARTQPAEESERQ